MPGFNLSHVTVVGGVLTEFEAISGVEYRARFTATPNLEVSASVTVDADFIDATGNSGSTAVQQIAVDTAAPTLVVTLDAS